MRRVWAVLVVGGALLSACAGAATVDPVAVVELSFDGGGDPYGCVGFVAAPGLVVTAGHCVAGPGGASPVVSVGGAVASGLELHPEFGGTSRLLGVDLARVTFDEPVAGATPGLGGGPLAVVVPGGSVAVERAGGCRVGGDGFVCIRAVDPAGVLRFGDSGAAVVEVGSGELVGVFVRVVLDDERFGFMQSWTDEIEGWAAG